MREQAAKPGSVLAVEFFFGDQFFRDVGGGPIILRLGLESCEVAIAIRVEQPQPRKVAFHAELFGRGGQQQQTRGLAAEVIDELILATGGASDHSR